MTSSGDRRGPRCTVRRFERVTVVTVEGRAGLPAAWAVRRALPARRTVENEGGLRVVDVTRVRAPGPLSLWALRRLAAKYAEPRSGMLVVCLAGLDALGRPDPLPPATPAGRRSRPPATAKAAANAPADNGTPAP